MNPIIYIAGPYRAANPWQVEQNIRVVELVAMRLAEEKIPFLCPHTMTRYMDGTSTDEYWLAMTMALMERCDWVLCVGDWQKSEGTNAEVRRAVVLGKEMYFDVDFCIHEWHAAQGVEA